MDLNIKFERGFIKPDKKSLLILGVILLIAVLVAIGLFYYFSREPEITIQEPPERGISEEILKQFRAPSNKGIEVSEEVLEQFGTSSEEEEISEDILEQFRAPN